MLSVLITISARLHSATSSPSSQAPTLKQPDVLPLCADSALTPSSPASDTDNCCGRPRHLCQCLRSRHRLSQLHGCSLNGIPIEAEERLKQGTMERAFGQTIAHKDVEAFMYVSRKAMNMRYEELMKVEGSYVPVQ